MNKKSLKIFLSILLVLSTILTATTPVFAYDDPARFSTVDDPSGTATKLQGTAGQILGVVQVIGVSVAIIMLIIIAIKYLSAAPNDKAEIKKHAVVYVIGAVVLFGAIGILGLISNFAQNIK